jgi:hypothetical protein
MRALAILSIMVCRSIRISKRMSWLKESTRYLESSSSWRTCCLTKDIRFFESFNSSGSPSSLVRYLFISACIAPRKAALLGMSSNFLLGFSRELGSYLITCSKTPTLSVISVSFCLHWGKFLSSPLMSRASRLWRKSWVLPFLLWLKS